MHHFGPLKSFPQEAVRPSVRRVSLSGTDFVQILVERGTKQLTNNTFVYAGQRLRASGLARCIYIRPFTSMPLIVPARRPCALHWAWIRLAHRRAGSQQAMKIKLSRQRYHVVEVRSEPIGVAAKPDLIRIRVRSLGLRIHARLGVDGNEIRLTTLLALRMQLFGSASPDTCRDFLIFKARVDLPGPVL